MGSQCSQGEHASSHSHDSLPCDMAQIDTNPSSVPHQAGATLSVISWRVIKEPPPTTPSLPPKVTEYWEFILQHGKQDTHKSGSMRLQSSSDVLLRVASTRGGSDWICRWMLGQQLGRIGWGQSFHGDFISIEKWTWI